MRVLLILVDGMRPDALNRIKYVNKIADAAQYTLNARTVFPSVTLPCHMSLFHSVEPTRHGILTNTYVPQVRSINGLFEVLNNAGKTTAFFYSWEQLRDLSRPGSVTFSRFYKGKTLGYDKANDLVTSAAIQTITDNYVDFTFLYLGFPDDAGHKYGWMSDEYMNSLENSWANIERILKALPDDYITIITADHGGHERSHGSELSEDMTIPIFYLDKGRKIDLNQANIKDIAPTITELLDVAPDEDWEGKSLLH